MNTIVESTENTERTAIQIQAQEAMLAVERLTEVIKIHMRQAQPNKESLAIIRCNCLDMQKHLDNVYYWSAKEYRKS
jgi:hypothetical protein